jgi:hypothetical protein
MNADVSRIATLPPTIQIGLGDEPTTIAFAS